jgi:hypothetical protein
MGHSHNLVQPPCDAISPLRRGLSAQEPIALVAPTGSRLYRRLAIGGASVTLGTCDAACSSRRLWKAVAEFQKVRALSGQSPYGLGGLGYALARSGNRIEALKILTELEEFSKQGYAVQVGIAAVHLGLGDKDRAFAWLEEAVREREAWDLKLDPFWQELRPDPRSTELLRKMNLEK